MQYIRHFMYAALLCYQKAKVGKEKERAKGSRQASTANTEDASTWIKSEVTSDNKKEKHK